MNTTDSKWYDIYVENEYLALCTDAQAEGEAISKVAPLLKRDEKDLFGVIHNFTVDPRDGINER